MKTIILPSAQSDLAAGFAFYENQEEGLGVYFMESTVLCGFYYFRRLESSFADIV